MGVVFRARDSAGCEVALKRLPDNLRDHPARAVFLREARAAAALNHPEHAVRRGSGRPGLFITMELLEGDRRT